MAECGLGRSHKNAPLWRSGGFGPNAAPTKTFQQPPFLPRLQRGLYIIRPNPGFRYAPPRLRRAYVAAALCHIRSSRLGWARRSSRRRPGLLSVARSALIRHSDNPRSALRDASSPAPTRRPRTRPRKIGGNEERPIIGARRETFIGVIQFPRRRKLPTVVRSGEERD
jgi:hypothetical protein